MNNKKTAIVTIIGYFITMMFGVFLYNTFSNLVGYNAINTMDINSDNIISKLVMQILPTIFLVYMIKKHFNWEEAGFCKINKKELIWGVPYIIVLIFMFIRFTTQIYQIKNNLNFSTYLIMGLTFIGTFLGAFSEEVMFRGILLNSFKREKSLMLPMIFSSLGFSICHITTLIMGRPIIDVFLTIVLSSLLGFAFVGLVIKINNIWPMIIFHVIWNFIFMISSTLQLEVSKMAGYCNILNVFIAIILWISVIHKDRKNLRSKYNV